VLIRVLGSLWVKGDRYPLTGYGQKGEKLPLLELRLVVVKDNGFAFECVSRDFDRF